ncbi:hypothetical protein WISP_84858 [Willisornis vidua]|uniref:Uncharacterized protein n=1 Tax=Willisornis vidua TaxID=1566151 RepID=A0ABQ9D8I3_9PASS|nr:hypothetical protein WISP_84858 [Willisornis vidua]
MMELRFPRSPWHRPWEAGVPLQPMEDHESTEIHMQPVKETHTGAVAEGNERTALLCLEMVSCPLGNPDNLNHRIIEWFESEGTLEII